LSRNEYEIEASQNINMKNEIKRTVRREVGNPNYYEVYYDHDGEDPATQIKNNLSALFSSLTPDQQKSSLVMLFCDESVGKDKANSEYRKAIEDVVKKDEGELVGTVLGDFKNKDSEEKKRYSRVKVAFLGMGLMERHRAPDSLKQKITDSIIGLLLRIGSSDDFNRAIREHDNSSLIEKILSGDLIIPLQKVNYEEIRDFMAREKEILRSL
jgi:hypothetical protein